MWAPITASVANVALSKGLSKCLSRIVEAGAVINSTSPLASGPDKSSPLTAGSSVSKLGMCSFKNWRGVNPLGDDVSGGMKSSNVERIFAYFDISLQYFGYWVASFAENWAIDFAVLCSQLLNIKLNFCFGLVPSFNRCGVNE